MVTMNRRDFLAGAGTCAVAAAAWPGIAAETDKIVVALIGVAHIHTPGYIDILKKRKDVRVSAVWDHQPARAEKAAAQVSAEPVKELRRIWEEPSIHAVVICSETNRHHDLVLAAAHAGKHMFVEKPLGASWKESAEMARAIEKANLLFNTGYFMRSDPKHIFLREEIRKGNFGKISRVRGSNCHSGSLQGWFDQDYRWMADPRISGVGAFGDLGTHKLDILMWFLGDIDAVTADVRTVTGRYGDCDETGEGLIQFRDGVIGTLAAGWVDVEDPVQLLISGTEGHASVVDNHLFYKSSHLPGSDSKEPFTNLPTAGRPPLHQFLDAIAGSKDQALVTPTEAAARVAVMEAMYKGARGRKWEKVPRE